MAREMKDSGVDWIGTVPREWAVLRGKDIFAKRSLPAFDADEIVTCFRNGQVTLRRNRREDGFTIALKEHGYQGVRVGDLVVHAMDAFAGAIGISDSNGKCSPVYSICRARFGSKTDLRFYSYVLRDMALNGYIQSVGLGIRERSTDFRFREVEAAFYCQPTLNGQRTIADYLDQQTALIDQRLGTLEEKKSVLAELRKATIHEAVTKGLNKNAPMQDSGVAWIGEIPQDWEVKPFKSVIAFREGPGIMAADFKDAGVPLLRIGNITQGLISLEGCNYLDPAKVSLQWNQFRVRQGDLIISASASVGIVSEVGEDAVGSIPYTGLITLRPSRRVLNNFLRYFVVSELFIDQILNFQKGATIQHYGPTHLKQMLIPLPPVEAQATIASHLDQQTQHIDAQLATLDEQAQVLKELRKAIIHEAVTGKIDLSGVESG